MEREDVGQQPAAVGPRKRLITQPGQATKLVDKGDDVHGIGRPGRPCLRAHGETSPRVLSKRHRGKCNEAQERQTGRTVRTSRLALPVEGRRNRRVEALPGQQATSCRFGVDASGQTSVCKEWPGRMLFVSSLPNRGPRLRALRWTSPYGARFLPEIKMCGVPNLANTAINEASQAKSVVSRPSAPVNPSSFGVGNTIVLV
jgi:hypothetical protein